MSTTGSITLVSGVATGTDFTNRIGRKVCWKSFLLTGYSIPQASSAIVPNLGRVMMIWDTQPNGVLPVMTDILLQSTSTSPMNLNNRDRFKVLWDKRVVNGYLNSVATLAVADQNIREVRKYKKINQETIFDGVAATIADVQTGAILLVTIGSADTTFAYNLVANVRCRFTDA